MQLDANEDRAFSQKCTVISCGIYGTHIYIIFKKTKFIVLLSTF